MVEALELRTKRDGSTFYRAAIFEEGGDRIKELYCKVDFKIRGLRGGGGEGANSCEISFVTGSKMKTQLVSFDSSLFPLSLDTKWDRG